MRLFETLCVLLVTITPILGLHFYLEAGEERCFIEELPSETVVEENYRALGYSAEEQKYLLNTQIGVQVDVHEIHSGHQVTKTTGPAEGRFTFTSHDPGDHSICLSTNETSSWFSNSHTRLYLDVVVGAARHDQDHDRKHAGQVSDKLRDLTDKLRNIRREQQYQREREAEFRNLSETTNSRAMWYMVIQLVVLVTTCYLQLRNLRHFFADRKAV